MISSDWEFIVAEDYCVKVTDGTHDSPKRVEVGKKLITSRHMNEFDLEFHNAYLISQEDYEKINERSKVDQYDVIFSMIGTVGTLYLEKSRYIDYVVKNVGIFKSKNEVDAKWLYYYLKSPIAKEYLFSHLSGSTQQYITLNSLRKYPILSPNLDSKQSIVHILSSLDDKIELNNKINKNLEDLAQTLYKRWFVDFEFPNEFGETYMSSGGEMVESEFGLIPKGWSVDTIGNLVDCIKEATKPGSHLKGRKYVPIDTLQSKKLTLSDYKSFSEANSSLILFEKMDILVGAMRVYFHKVNLSFYPGITRTTTFVLRSKSEFEVPFNLLTLNQDSTIDYANGTSKGSTMPYAVWQNALDKYKVINPGIDVKKSFYDLIMPNLELINTYNEQNSKLVRLRDELLPKLMSGEMEVPIEE
jgi:type I restriction enzyme S subunit